MSNRVPYVSCDAHLLLLTFTIVTQYVFKTTAAAEHAFCVTSFWSPILTAMVRFRDLFHALCAMFSAACATLHDSDTGIMKTVLYHRLKAIQILRARLLQANARADDGALLTIIMLSVVDKHSRDEDAFQIHQQQAETMIRVRGSISALDSQYGVRAFLRQGRALSAPELNNFPDDHSISNNPIPSKLATPTSAVPHQPVYTLSPNIMALIPAGFHPLIVARPALLSLSTTRCIMRIAATQSSSLQIPTGTSTNSTLVLAASQIPTNDRDPHAPSAYESYNDACPALNSPTASLFEKLLCFALVRCVVNRVSLYRTWMCPYEEIALILTNKLPRTSLPALDTPSGAAQREALLWIWLTTIDAWSIGLPSACMRPQGRELLKHLYERFTETHGWSVSDWHLWSKRWFVRREVWAWFENEWPTIVMEATLEKLTGEERSEVKGKKVCEELLDEFMDGNLVAGGAFVGDERTRAFEGLTRGLSN